LFLFTVSIALHTYMRVLKEYRDGEPSFAKKYVEQWRDRFMNVPKVKYEDPVQRE
jgi:hypothetical protein